MATSTSSQADGRLEALPLELKKVVASCMELPEKLGIFSASLSLLKVFAPTVTSLKLSSSTWRAPTLTTEAVQHLLARHPRLTSLVVYEAREDAAILYGLAACLEAGATEQGRYLSFLEHLEVKISSSLSRMDEGVLDQGLAALVKALAAAMQRGGLAHLEVLRLPYIRFQDGAPHSFLDPLTAGKCHRLHTIDIDPYHSREKALIMCKERQAIKECRGLKTLPFLLHFLKKPDREVGCGVVRKYMASSLERFEIRDNMTMSCFEAVNPSPSLRHLELRARQAKASVIDHLVAGKAPNLTSLRIVRDYMPPGGPEYSANSALDRLCEAIEQGHFKNLQKLFLRVETDDQLQRIGTAMAAPRAGGMADLRSLTLMGLIGHETTAAGLEPLMGLLRAGGCRSLQELELAWFEDGDEVVEALAEVWADTRAAAASGRSMRSLSVYGGGGIGDAGLVLLAHFFEEGGLSRLERLDLGLCNSTKFSITGIRRLVAALSTASAGRSLRELTFFRKLGPGPEKLRPGYDALGMLLLEGGLPRLKTWDEYIVCSPALTEAIRQEFQFQNRKCEPFT